MPASPRRSERKPSNCLRGCSWARCGRRCSAGRSWRGTARRSAGAGAGSSPRGYACPRWRSGRSAAPAGTARQAGRAAGIRDGSHGPIATRSALRRWRTGRPAVVAGRPACAAGPTVPVPGRAAISPRCRRSAMSRCCSGLRWSSAPPPARRVRPGWRPGPPSARSAATPPPSGLRAAAPGPGNTGTCHRRWASVPAHRHPRPPAR